PRKKAPSPRTRGRQAAEYTGTATWHGNCSGVLRSPPRGGCCSMIRRSERRKEKMKRTIIRNELAVFGVALLGFGAQGAVAIDHCNYKGTMSSDGAAACQTGAQYRCEDGEWKALGVACRDAAPAPPQPLAAESCQFGGVSYASGSASCQGGKHYMWDDSTWKSLRESGPVADLPIPANPSGLGCL